MDPRDVAAIPLFAGLSKDDQQVVAQYADQVDVPAGAKLAQEGRLAYEFFAIHCPFLEPLRGTSAFDRVLAKSARRVAEFSA